MRSVLRIGLVLVLLCSLGLRAVEFHSHDGTTAHPDSCAICRVLHSPFVTPTHAPVVAALVAAAPDRSPARPDDIPPQSPHLASLHLRAPPLA